MKEKIRQNIPSSRTRPPPSCSQNSQKGHLPFICVYLRYDIQGASLRGWPTPPATLAQEGKVHGTTVYTHTININMPRGRRLNTYVFFVMDRSLKKNVKYVSCEFD